MILDDVAYVELPLKAEGTRTRIKKFDLLVTITGANVTKTALVKNEIGEAYVNQHVSLVRLKNNDNAFYIHLWLISPNTGRKQLEEAAYGAGKPGLNLQNIKDVLIPLPPLEEQKEIVRQVDKLFALADKVESHYQRAKARVDKLSQSVLVKAFRGELVPQDPNDEPAEKLLERILEEKSKMEAELKVTRKRWSKK
ncbi:MAG: restriction endonuclease subunit S [Deltaproteobacteria bacterium]|nr:restriction endonuclease subunit S [Deltaproteobacteria bacterium]